MDSNIKMKVMKNASVIQKENGFGRLLKFDCSDGLGLMTVYNVFPGIELIYNEFETTEFSWKNNTSGNVMEINHCREGREGSQLKNGAYLYLGEGDLSIHMMENCAPVMSFPLKHYRGVSVDLEGCEIRDKLHVLNMKADDYIEKPINIDELEEKMLQLLHKLS